jgi:ABC-type bacteriocin/lantibiotic exporter with double-glycine peptidase domain
MKFVKQKHKTGCAIACTAMLLDVNYNHIYKYMLPLASFRCKTKSVDDHWKQVKNRFKININVINDRKLFSLKKPAIIVIDNNDGTAHAVVWDAKNRIIMDPYKSRIKSVKNIKLKIKSRILYRIEFEQI